ncbi:unnamed protein product [Durusdinium trenchii]|uniref:Uncharacterized protein n=1 Tax=Durusdinium trenchii TaxID=1381693 RepID=A0ABP0SG71_9DINO
MSRITLSEEEGAAALKAAGIDIKYFFERHEVAPDNQKIFCHSGVTTLEKLSNFAKDKEDLIAVLKKHWGLDQERSLDERVQVAAMIYAYTNARTRVQRTAEVDVEYDTQQWMRPIVAGEWAAMRSAIEKRYGQIEDKIIPAKEVVEKKLAEVEAGEYRAEDLAKIMSKDEVEPDTVIPIWDAKGRLAMRRGSTKVAEPTNAEELRRRLTVWKNMMVMVSLNETIEQYKDYLLGEFAYGLSTKDSDGQTFASPPWSLVLSYERAMRKQMVKIINTEGKPLVVATQAAEREASDPLRLANARGIRLEITELDIQRDRKLDLIVPSIQKNGCRKLLKAGILQVVWANDRDPYPLRSFAYPRGFKWNRGPRFHKAAFGTTLADFSFEAMKRQFRRTPEGDAWPWLGKLIFLEALKVLGSVSEGEREAFRMARGGGSFNLVKDEAFLEATRSLIAKRWALERELWEEAVWQKDNYASAGEHEEYLKQHLDQEVKDGLMHCMSERDFIEEYGDNRAVASLAVLAEDAITGRRRIIHDATHGARVNHRIQCRDKVRMPGPREKAHRRFKYQASEQGLLARKASSNSETIYVNRMGTFGVPSPYWWGRLSAFTDNKGNSFIVKKELSTKFPITLLVIELAETLRSKDSFTILAWVPRERNTLADALTNLDFEAFDLGLRESVCEDGLRRLVMDDLMESSKVLFDEIKAHKQNKKSGVKTGSKKTQKFFTKWTS